MPAAATQNLLLAICIVAAASCTADMLDAFAYSCGLPCSYGAAVLVLSHTAGTAACSNMSPADLSKHSSASSLCCLCATWPVDNYNADLRSKLANGHECMLGTYGRSARNVRFLENR